MQRKISIIGAGQVGSHAAAACLQRALGEIVLMDIQPGLAHGRALDIAQAQAIRGGERRSIRGTADIADTANSAIVVITAGQARKPGMTRADLLNTNAAIIAGIVEAVVRQSPDCLLVVVTNPINTLVQYAQRLSGLPPERVIGMAGTLDNARLRWALADQAGTGTDAVDCWVIGDHGEHMVPVLSHSRLNGRPLTDGLSDVQISAAVARARAAGTEIVEALGNGSAAYAPGEAIAILVEALCGKAPRRLCCSCLVQGHYSIDSLYIGMVADVNRDGVQAIVELALSDAEYHALQDAVSVLRARAQTVPSLPPKI